MQPTCFLIEELIYCGRRLVVTGRVLKADGVSDKIADARIPVSKHILPRGSLKLSLLPVTLPMSVARLCVSCCCAFLTRSSFHVLVHIALRVP